MNEISSLYYVRKCRVVMQNLNNMLATCKLEKSDSWNHIFTIDKNRRQIPFQNILIGLMTDGDFESVIALLCIFLQNETLGFAHFDVEGGELGLLQGAAGIIGRSRPIFTTEVHLDVLPRYTQRLLSLLDGLGYHSYVVQEPCGARSDCRNLLNLPRLHRPRVPDSFAREFDSDEWLARSPELRRAFDAGQLVPAHVAVAQRPWANASRRTRSEAGGEMQARSGEMRIPPGLLGLPYMTDVDRGLFAARAA